MPAAGVNGATTINQLSEQEGGFFLGTAVVRLGTGTCFRQISGILRMRYLMLRQ